jgi:hypothetical protein
MGKNRPEGIIPISDEDVLNELNSEAIFADEEDNTLCRAERAGILNRNNRR